MRPESPNRDSLKDILPTVALLGAVVFLSQLACSKKVRQEVKRRDGFKSVWSGKTENLEVAHISHDRDDASYNTSQNARTLTTGEHLWDHINRHGRNGSADKTRALWRYGVGFGIGQ
jgi:hypothetical protein